VPDVTFYAWRFGESDQGLWRYARGTAVRLSPDSLTVTGSFAVAPDGRVAYVVDRPALLRADIVEQSADGRRLRTIVAGAMPAGGGTAPRQLAYSPDGSRLAWTWTKAEVESLYVADAGATDARGLAARVRVEYLDPSGSIVVAPMRWSPQGEVVFGPARTLAGVDPVTGAVRPIASGLGHIFDFDFAADGRLAVSSQPAGEFARRILVQQSVGAPLAELPGSTGRFSNAVRWAPDGRRIATIGPDTTWVETGPGTGFQNEEPVLRVLTLDGAGARQTAVRVASIHGWTPDGHVVLSGRPASGGSVYGVEVYVVDPHRGARNVSNTPLIDERLATMAR
jgi:Tol biopolymer transport system component